MKISSLPKITSSALIGCSILLVGAGCTISLGQPKVTPGGVYRSDDHGLTWKRKSLVRRENNRTVTIDDTTTQTLVIDPKNSQRLWLGTKGQGIWWTTNAGERWQSSSLTSGSFRCIEYDPLNTDILYTASGLRAYKSVDGGKTWTVIYTESQPKHLVTCLALDPTRVNVLWMVTSGGKILQSIDFGQHWTLTGSMPKLTIRRMYVDRAGSGAVYIFSTTKGIHRIEPNGQAAVALNQPLAEFKGAATIQDVEIVAGTDTWYLATAYGLLVSADRGEHWAAIPTLLTPRSTSIENIVVSHLQPAEMFITAGLKLHHTVDNGQTWEVDALPGGRAPVALMFDPNNIQRMYFGTIQPPKK